MGSLLRKSGSKSIIEVSHKDRFWGTVRPKENSNLVEGDDLLGKLLMKLRDFYAQNQGSSKLLKVPPLELLNFNLVGQPIEPVDCFSLKLSGNNK